MKSSMSFDSPGTPGLGAPDSISVSPMSEEGSPRSRSESVSSLARVKNRKPKTREEREQQQLALQLEKNKRRLEREAGILLPASTATCGQDLSTIDVVIPLNFRANVDAGNPPASFHEDEPYPSMGPTITGNKSGKEASTTAGTEETVPRITIEVDAMIEKAEAKAEAQIAAAVAQAEEETRRRLEAQKKAEEEAMREDNHDLAKLKVVRYFAALLCS